MTIEKNAAEELSCQRCSFPNRIGDQFCARCGEAFIAPSAMLTTPLTPAGPRPEQSDRPARRAPGAPPAQRDATTRYLCAAAHLDPEFSDAAIAEFLVEPVRAIAPAPGVDSAAVLRDAVAARARRRLRDAVLLALLVILVFVSLPVLVVWLIVALIASAGFGWGAPRTPRTPRNVVILALLVLVGIVLLPPLLGIDLSNALPGSVDGLVPEAPYGLVTIVVLAFAVIAVNEFTVHHLVYTSFRRSRFAPDGRQAVTGWERAIRCCGLGSFQAPLARVAAADERATQHPGSADVIVHRGFSPFVGAGKRVYQQIIALRLEPDETDKDGGKTHQQTQEISVVDLHRHVADAIDNLRSSSSLGPSGRFTGLTRREQVLMAAYRLATNRDTQLGDAVLRDLYRPPAADLPVSVARRLADAPEEWARYYQCFRIEAWERDLTTSCYLHAGTDQRMLFLEWNFCILPPIRNDYRRIDRLQDPFLVPLRRTIADFVTLPATAIHRFRSVFRRFDPLRQREGEIVPDRYGAAESLRELAADDDVQNYFQDVDVQRYVKILDATLVRAVGEYLEDHGYSVVDFMRQAVPVVNQTQNNFAGNTFYNSAVGSGNTVQGNVSQSPPPKGSP